MINKEIHGIYKPFHDFAYFLHSLPMIMIALTVFYLYRFYELNHVFDQYTSLHGTNKDIANALLSIIFFLSVLISSIHSDELGKYASRIMAYVTLVINIYFWVVWQGDTLTIIFKAFLSIVSALFDYYLTFLFIRKVKQLEILQDLGNILEIQKTATLQNQDLKNENRQLVKEVEDKKRRLEKFACPYCTQPNESIKARNGHMKGCKKRKEELGPL